MSETADASNLQEIGNDGSGSPPPVFLCVECNLIFDSTPECTQHMNHVHDLKEFNFSEIELVGEESNRDADAAPVHNGRKGHPPAKPLATGRSIVIPDEFQVQEIKLYGCSLCTFKFESPQVLEFHEGCHNDVEEILPEPEPENRRGFICRICQGSSSSVSIKNESGLATDKEESHHFARWHKCSWHLWKAHKIDCELYTCSTEGCEFKSFFKHKVREHASIHSLLFNYPCQICHKTFRQLTQLRAHQKYHRAKSTKLPPPADSRWYTTQKCEICSRILSDSKCLKKHIAAVHRKLKPHSCNICGHQSARKAELLLHMRQHTGEKPYKCPSCPFATGDHNSLRRHVLTHSTNSKPYICPRCPFKCIQSSGFKKHVISKHSEDTDSIFPCPYCPFISVNSCIYENHIRDHDQGRIPIQDMQGTKEGKDSSPVKSKVKPFVHVDDSSSNSNMSGTGVRTMGYWNRAEDESSLEMVDTGGITIPAIPTPTPELWKPTS